MSCSAVLRSLLVRGVLVLAGLLVGCEAQQPQPAAITPSTQPPTAGSLENNKRPDEDISIRLQVASWEQTQALIAGQQGKIVVLDLWSTYCPPCLKELPQLVKLHQLHGDKVVCFSLNCNFTGDGSPDDERSAIETILAKMKAPFLNLISSDADQALYQKVGIASIPVVQVYDRSGKLRKQFDNEKNEYGKEGFTYSKHIVPFVEQLLKEPAP